MHPRGLRCSSLKYSRYSRSSRLAREAPRPSRCDATLSPRAASRCAWSCVGLASRIARNCWVERERRFCVQSVKFLSRLRWGLLSDLTDSKPTHILTRRHAREAASSYGRKSSKPTHGRFWEDRAHRRPHRGRERRSRSCNPGCRFSVHRGPFAGRSSASRWLLLQNSQLVSWWPRDDAGGAKRSSVCANHCSRWSLHSTGGVSRDRSLTGCGWKAC